MKDDDQPMLPLDERFRQAEQYSLDLQPPAAPQARAPRPDYTIESCPHHGSVFVSGCRFCNPQD